MVKPPHFHFRSTRSVSGRGTKTEKCHTPELLNLKPQLRFRHPVLSEEGGLLPCPLPPARGSTVSTLGARGVGEYCAWRIVPAPWGCGLRCPYTPRPVHWPRSPLDSPSLALLGKNKNQKNLGFRQEKTPQVGIILFEARSPTPFLFLLSPSTDTNRIFNCRIAVF